MPIETGYLNLRVLRAFVIQFALCFSPLLLRSGLGEGAGDEGKNDH